MPKLDKSSQDDICLASAVQDRFLDLCGAYRRIRGIDLVPPPELDRAMLLWRGMVLRHRGGDMRNSEEELQAVKEIATWLVQTNRALRNQAPLKMMWREDVGLPS